MEYGIAVTNKFDMFIDECDDPIENLQRIEAEAALQKKAEKDAAAKNVGKKGAAGAKTATKPAASKEPAPAASKAAPAPAAEPKGRAAINSQEVPRRDNAGSFEVLCNEHMLLLRRCRLVNFGVILRYADFLPPWSSTGSYTVPVL